MKLVTVADQAEFIDLYEKDDLVGFGDSNPDGSIANGYIAPVYEMRINGMDLDELFMLYEWVAVLKQPDSQ
jgi:hypothetical protein